jgi:hypothetical protein
MLCQVGKDLLKELNAAAQEVGEANAAMTQSRNSQKLRHEALTKAHKHHKAVAEAFLEHKVSCIKCQTSDSEVRRRASSSRPAPKP